MTSSQPSSLRPVQKKNELLSARLHLFQTQKKLNLLARCVSCHKSFPTMLTRSNLIGTPNLNVFVLLDERQSFSLRALPWLPTILPMEAKFAV
jgi:hypothetical protein